MPNSTSPTYLWRRLASMAYDSLLLLAVLAVALVLPHILVGALLHRVATPALLWAHLLLILALYFAWFWAHGGQTPAMKTWHIRLTNHDGGPVHAGQALLRFLLCWPSLGLAGIGLLWALIDRDGQFLHDRLAGTRLIQTRA